jgi:hypothetical protein
MFEAVRDVVRLLPNAELLGRNESAEPRSELELPKDDPLPNDEPAPSPVAND